MRSDKDCNLKAPAHPLETERLAILRSYEILDTEPENDFDDIVKLAAAICDAPIALVSLLDKDRQWFKAELGLGTHETPMEQSMCAHAIHNDDITEINDTRLDPRTADNALVSGKQGLYFYAGAVLATEDGIPVGTLCVLDHKPRKLTPLQRDTLRVLARQVIAQLDMRKALRTAKLLRQEVDHRVKNSLQSLSSLTSLQARKLKSPEAVKAMSDIKARLDAVSTLHEQLYQTDAGANLNLGAYVDSILAHMNQVTPAHINIHAETVAVRVSSQQAVAVGTLVNEFVANAIKHAFPDQQAGNIKVTMTLLPDGQVRLHCADDGIGLSDDLNEGLGMSIAEVACMELGCELKFDDVAKGLAASCTFTPQLREWID